MNETIAALAAELAVRFDTVVLAPIAARLELDETLEALRVTHPPALAHRLGELRRACEAAAVASTAVALALRAAITAAERASREKVSLAWTGPISHPASGRSRRLDQALYEVIERADASLLLMTYAAWPHRPLLEALEAAVARGVGIRVVMETAAASGGALSSDTLDEWRRELPRARFLVWSAERRAVDVGDGSGVMHGKVAVADRRLALVSSANLTGRALTSNLEMGVLLEGGWIPGRIADYVDELVEGNVITDC